MSKPRVGPVVLASLSGLVVGFLVYGARAQGACLESYPPICENMFGRALGDDWDQPVWQPTLAAGTITFLIVWLAVELLVRWRAARPSRPASR